MFQQIKELLPKPVKKFLRIVKQRTYDQWHKKRLFKRMQIKHAELLKQLKGKEKIKVVFLAIHKSVWKVDPVFKKMMEDPFFEPEILVCPYTMYGEERMLEDMELAYSYFLEKGYPVKKSRNDDGSWVKLEEIKPDIVFFTNPHKLTHEEYYENAYLNYLSCYVPYYFMATKHAGKEANQFNSLFFTSAWRLYWPNSYCKAQHKKLSVGTGLNGLAVGYPAAEGLVNNVHDINSNCWKSQANDTKKIIYAPHHSIGWGKRSLATFLQFGEVFQKLAEKHAGKVQWSFKPHPMLKARLYEHVNWDREKTDAYYEFWNNQDYTQLDEGEYDDLFLSSDAIIHDCSSFIVEYAFTKKPCLYLVNENNLKGLLNAFGEGVMQVYEQARTVTEIEGFIDGIVNETIQVDESKRAYFDAYVDEYYKGKLPSERIIDDIKQSLGVLSDQ